MLNIYGRKIKLRDWQKRATQELSLRMDGEHFLALVAPTGAGKTPVAYKLMEEAVRNGMRAIYASPLKAISNERFVELKRSPIAGEEPGIITGDIDINPGSNVLMVTTEILRNNPSLMENALVVFDEVHYVSVSPDRARTFAETLMAISQKVNFAIPFILTATLAPTEEEMHDVVSFLAGLAGKEPYLFVYDKRPIPLVAPKRPFSIKRISDALVFVNSYRDAFVVANKIASFRKPSRSKWKRFKEIWTSIGGERSGYIRRALISRGVGIHHGNLLPGEKLAVEQAFREGILDVVVGTTTLAYGVNMPAEKVVFDQSRRYDGTPYSPSEFLQMAGRAGRPGLSKVGLVGGFRTSVHKWVKAMLREAKPSFILKPMPSARPFVEVVSHTGSVARRVIKKVVRDENRFLREITYGAEPARVTPADYKHIAAKLLILSSRARIPLGVFAEHVLRLWSDELMDGWMEGQAWFMEVGLPYVVEGWDGAVYRIDAYPLVAAPLVDEKLEKGGVSGKTLYAARQRLKWLKSIGRRASDIVDVYNLEEAEDVVESVDPLKSRLEEENVDLDM